MGFSRFPTRNVNFEQLVAAIEDDSYEQATGYFFENSKGKSYACALGQGAMNLGVDADDLASKIGPLSNIIFNFNDTDKLSIKQVARRLHRDQSDRYAGTIWNVKRKDWAGVAPDWRGVSVPRGAVAAR